MPYHSIRVHFGDIFDLPCDAYVSPANSFGDMPPVRGGIDSVYVNRFPGIDKAIQHRIVNKFDGELLVGQAFVLKPLIVAPTMRVPAPIHDPTDVYLSTRAAIRAALNAGVETVNMPGMGTLTGQVPPHIAARYMIQGIKHALNPEPFPATRILE